MAPRIGETKLTKHIWIPSSETHCTLTQEGTLTVWEDMTMQRRPIAGKGFQSKPPADKQAARAKRA